MTCSVCGYPINPGAVNHPGCVAKRIEELEAALREIADFTADVPDDDPLSHVHGIAALALAKST